MAHYHALWLGPEEVKKKEAAKAQEGPERDVKKTEMLSQNPRLQGRKMTQSMAKTREVDLLTKELEDFEMKKASALAVTGILVSHSSSTDVHIFNLSLIFLGEELLSDTKL